MAQRDRRRNTQSKQALSGIIRSLSVLYPDCGSVRKKQDKNGEAWSSLRCTTGKNTDRQKRGCSRCDPARTLNAHARHHAPLLLKMAAFATTTPSLKVRARAVPPCAPQRRPRRRFRPRVNREAGFRSRGSPIRARAHLAEIAPHPQHRPRDTAAKRAC